MKWAHVAAISAPHLGPRTIRLVDWKGIASSEPLRLKDGSSSDLEVSRTVFRAMPSGGHAVEWVPSYGPVYAPDL